MSSETHPPSSTSDVSPSVREPEAGGTLQRIETWIRALADAHGSVEVAGYLAEGLQELLPDSQGEVRLRGADDEQWIEAASWPTSEGERPVDAAVRRARSPFSRRTFPVDNATRLPLARHGEALGEVRLCSRSATEPLGDETLRCARILSATATSALAAQALQTHLRQRNVRDPMTGLFNARYLEDTLTRELLRARRAGVTLILVRLEVDNYADRVEELGRDAAHTIIQDLAGVLQDSFRGSDVWCRVGEASFAVLLPEAHLDGGTERAEGVRRELATRTPRYRGRSLGPFPISGGVAAYPIHADTADLLTEAAESAVQLARDAGGNALRRAEPARGHD